MFSSLQLFKNIACPKGVDCSLIACFFDHETTKSQPEDEVTELTKAIATREYDPLSAGGVSPPAAKRRKLDLQDTNAPTVRDASTDSHAQAVPTQSHVSEQVLASTETSSYHKDVPGGGSAQITKPVSSLAARTTSVSQLNPLSKDRRPDPQTAHAPAHQPAPASMARKISPPAKQNGPSSKLKPPVGPPEKLLPRQVAKSPVPFKSRLSYVELLYKLVQTHNSKLAKGGSTDKALALMDQELIKLILDDEEKAASAASADVYKNSMSQHYLHYKNMAFDDWKKFVIERIRPPMIIAESTKGGLTLTGLSSSEEINLLRGLKTAVTGLETYGYVTVPPTAGEIEKTDKVTTMAHGFEVCDRCGTRFQVFPGRNSEGKLTTQGECYYHWGKASRMSMARGVRTIGQPESLHPCCNKTPGSEGCTRADTHVYKISDPKRLAKALQFERTPAQSDGKPRRPVAFDCEMAYTTLGMELVRVTALSWPENDELLDVLVRPYGEILDLNTRFSGVSKDQFMAAPAYSKDLGSEDTHKSPNNDAPGKPLRKVNSVAAARTLLFDLLTPDTPLIGHAIENDLNACRIIHPFIVDTVLLYPHPAGLPVRYGLKYLASKYLHRGIQTGGEQGHDSKEDSSATGDLVRAKVAEKWKSMKLQGWRFEGGRLQAPTKTT